MHLILHFFGKLIKLRNLWIKSYLFLFHCDYIILQTLFLICVIVVTREKGLKWNYLEILTWIFLISYRYIDVTDSLTERLSFLTISLLFMMRFGSSLRFCHLEFYKKAISYGFMADSRVFLGGGGLKF